MRVEDQFLYLYFLLRSPYTDDDYDAWVVWSGGAVRSSDYVYSSYGSPDPRDSTGIFQYCILQFGDPRAGNYVDFSYGSPHFNDIAFGYYTHIVGYIDVSINISANSYGYKIYSLSGHER